MKTKYYVCGLGYDKNEHLNGYEQDFGVFNTYVEAYEFFVKLQCKGANALFTEEASEAYRLVVQLEECEITEEDGIHVLKIHNRSSFINPNLKKHTKQNNKEDTKMKLKELKSILCSQTGKIQWAIVYKQEEDKDLEYGCSIDYAVEQYGEYEVKRINSILENGKDYLLITL